VVTCNSIRAVRRGFRSSHCAGAALFVTVLLRPAVVLGQCGGDCDGSNDVTIAELITLVNVALGNGAASSCAAGDANRNGQITIDEILAALNHALCGCAGPCPTPAPTNTRPPLPSPSATFPSLEDVPLTEAQIRAAVTEALQGTTDPWGVEFGIVLSRILAFLHVRETASAVRSRGAAAGLVSDCLDQYCGQADYCGFPSNSVTVPPRSGSPTFYWHVNDCVNHACFVHDLTSFQQCISGSRDPFGQVTGRPDCYFSEQSSTVDAPFFTALETCPQRNADRILRLIVDALRLRSLCSEHRGLLCIPDACQEPACDEGSCDSSTGSCTASKCGNCRIDLGEECDPPVTKSVPETCADRRPDCRDDCTLATCGDGVADYGEQCDGGDFHDLQCAEFGYRSGTLQCTTSCRIDLTRCRDANGPLCLGAGGFQICGATLLMQGALYPVRDELLSCSPMWFTTPVAVTIQDLAVPCFGGEVPCTEVCNTSSAPFFPGNVFGGYVDDHSACLTGVIEHPQLYLLLQGTATGSTITADVLDAADGGEGNCHYRGSFVINRFPRPLPR